MIYVIIASTSFAIELLVWWLTSQDSIRSWTRRHSVEVPLWRAISSQIRRRNSDRWSKHVGMHEMLRWFKEASIRDKVEILVLRPFDVVSSTWLVYIVYVILYSRTECTGLTFDSLAQTFGSYQTCRCMSSVWGWHAQHVKLFPTTESTCTNSLPGLHGFRNVRAPEILSRVTVRTRIDSDQVRLLSSSRCGI